jgi:hypothetical protein
MPRNAITGADTVAALKVGTTFGTAATFAAGDRYEFENLDAGRNPEELAASPKGSGQIMANESQQGAISPTITIEKLEHFNDAGTAAEAVFFGNEGVTNVHTGQAWTHSIICSDTFNNSYLTHAYQFTGGSIMESASCTPIRLTATYENPPNYGRISLELLANDIIQESTTNTYSAMQSLTIADSERIVGYPDDEFLINIQSSGALTSPTHRLSVKSLVATYEKPQEHTREFKGSLGNGEPVPVGDPPFMATLAVTLSGLDASTYFQRAREGTEYKASFTLTGSLIAGGVYKRLVRQWPRLKLVQDPTYSVSSAGINEVTLNFKCLVAASVPTGMLSVYPATLVTNTRSNGYL